MKRVTAPGNEPTILADFRTAHPQGTWKPKPGSDQPAFKNEPGNEAVYVLLAMSQGHLCAYCEIDIERGLWGQVEHYVPEDMSDELRNYALEFDNMLACCEGGTRIDISNGRAEPPIPETLHCGQLKGNQPPAGRVLDPRQLASSPCIWMFRSDGSMMPIEDHCIASGIPLGLAVSTIEVLGLDRKGLRRMREGVLEGLDFEFELLLEDGVDETIALARVAEEQLVPQDGKLPAFWSTTRFWAGEAADDVLAAHARTIPGMATP